MQVVLNRWNHTPTHVSDLGSPGIAKVLLSCLVLFLSTNTGICETKPINDTPPNIIIVLVDDMGYGDIGCYGAPRIKTPNFDRMAQEGTRFTDFYVQPVCGVSRASLMTGCYPIRLAEVENRKEGHPVLHPGEITIAEVLKTRGYATALIGKWHLGGRGANSRGPGTGPFRNELMPRAQGFDEFYGTPLHNGFTRLPNPKSFITELMRNEQMLESPTDMDLLTQKYTDEAIQFLQRNRDRPFFLYLAHNMPHVPLGASEAFRGSSEQGLYGDVIQELDSSTGRILATLKELGIDEKTLVIFTSDNGPWVESQLAEKGGLDPYYGSADPLRGWKMQTWDGGIRVPCIMRWKGKIPAGRVCNEMLTSMDLFPSLAGLAGADLPEDRTLDGLDVWPVLIGESNGKNPRETFFFYCYNHLQAVRHDDWKLVLPRPNRAPWCSWSSRMVTPVDMLELYDLRTDISESKNVADENPEVVAELMKLIEQARVELGDYDRIGQGARFFDEGVRRPDTLRWAKPKPEDGGGIYPRSFTYSTAIAHEPRVTRRDPSDVICVDDTFHVWYSKVAKGPNAWGYPSGYSADVYHASSPDGITWTEQGLAIEKGTSDDWDGHGVFTPNILAAEDRFFLFYTGVPRPFDADTKTAIGLAVAEKPEGPWKKLSTNPVLLASEEPEKFDSMRVDDASLVVREGNFWLYYKGRQLAHSPGETKMGLATAEKPEGPYVKHPAGSLHPGHEVLVWPHGTGVASMATAAGPRTIYFATDGLDFAPRNPVSNAPRAPGGFRPDHFENDTTAGGLPWGISHTSEKGDLYLVRFDSSYTPGYSQSRRRHPRPVPYDNFTPVGDFRFDFESGDLQGWKVTEGEFDLIVSDRKALPQWKNVPFNKQGTYHLSTLECTDDKPALDAMTGIIESPHFVITGKKMSFLVGGGDGPETYVALCTADGKELMRAGGTNSPVLRRVQWDVTPHVKQEVFLRIVDHKTRDWAHITFDDFSAEAE